MTVEEKSYEHGMLIILLEKLNFDGIRCGLFGKFASITTSFNH